MKYILRLLLFILISINTLQANTIDENIRGIWNISSIKKHQGFHILGAISFSLTIKFENNGIVRRVDSKTLKAEHSEHAWEVDDGVLNLRFVSPADNFLSRFMFRSTFNAYLEVVEKLDSRCNKMKLTNGGSSMFVKMCKVKN